MKNLIKGAALLFLAITFAACQQAADPVSPDQMGKNLQQADAAGTGTGTFEITLLSSSISDPSGTLAGTINFRFDDATSRYKYKGAIKSTSIETRPGIFEGTGTFVRRGDYINLIDDQTVEAESAGIHSLYLNGDFRYIVTGTKTIIEGDTRTGHLKITLD